MFENSHKAIVFARKYGYSINATQAQELMAYVKDKPAPERHAYAMLFLKALQEGTEPEDKSNPECCPTCGRHN